MKTAFIGQQGSNLILYFAGWGTPPSAVAHLQIPPNFDLLICYDYQDLQLEFDFSCYQEIYLVAWSMGVWVAEQVLQNQKVAIHKAVAINGTPKPNDDQFGIPSAIFQGTLDHLNATTRNKFERRMCQSREVLAQYQQLPDYRPLENVQQELKYLDQQIKQRPTTTFLWHQAWIATQDHIFPVANQQAYWQSHCPVKTIEAGHYAFPYFQQWQQLWH